MKPPRAQRSDRSPKLHWTARDHRVPITPQDKRRAQALREIEERRVQKELEGEDWK